MVFSDCIYMPFELKPAKKKYLVNEYLFCEEKIGLV